VLCLWFITKFYENTKRRVLIVLYGLVYKNPIAANANNIHWEAFIARLKAYSTGTLSKNSIELCNYVIAILDESFWTLKLDSQCISNTYVYNVHLLNCRITVHAAMALFFFMQWSNEWFEPTIFATATCNFVRICILLFL
jgi:hypothetical protein